MKLSFTLFLIAICSFQIKADTFHYTVVAKSGLNLRTEKNLNSKMITIVPYLTVVELLGNYANEKITVEEVEGFWVHVRHNKDDGYLYSGYLYPGLILYSINEKILSNFVVLDEFSPE